MARNVVEAHPHFPLKYSVNLISPPHEQEITHRRVMADLLEINRTASHPPLPGLSENWIKGAAMADCQIAGGQIEEVNELEPFEWIGMATGLETIEEERRISEVIGY